MFHRSQRPHCDLYAAPSSAWGLQLTVATLSGTGTQLCKFITGFSIPPQFSLHTCRFTVRARFGSLTRSFLDSVVSFQDCHLCSSASRLQAFSARIWAGTYAPPRLHDTCSSVPVLALLERSIYSRHCKQLLRCGMVLMVVHLLRSLPQFIRSDYKHLKLTIIVKESEFATRWKIHLRSFHYSAPFLTVLPSAIESTLHTGSTARLAWTSPTCCTAAASILFTAVIKVWRGRNPHHHAVTVLPLTVQKTQRLVCCLSHVAFPLLLTSSGLPT